MADAKGSEVHHSAVEGYTANAQGYVRGRPGYPPQVLDWLKNDLALAPGKVVIDLGAGTGKFTTLLLKTGARVIAVEPVAQMRAQLAQAAAGAELMDGTAQSIPLPDASVDAVICAQAFHWFASAAALDEIRRVLKPGGRLGLIWNTRDARVDWVARMDAIVNPHEGDVPRFYTGAWRKAFPHAGFGPLQEHHFSQGHAGPAEDVIINRVHSTSFISAMPPEQWHAIERELRALIDSEPALRDQAQVVVPYETVAFVAQALPA